MDSPDLPEDDPSWILSGRAKGSDRPTAANGSDGLEGLEGMHARAAEAWEHGGGHPPVLSRRDRLACDNEKRQTNAQTSLGNEWLG